MTEQGMIEHRLGLSPLSHKTLQQMLLKILASRGDLPWGALGGTDSEAGK